MFYIHSQVFFETTLYDSYNLELEEIDVQQMMSSNSKNLVSLIPGDGDFLASSCPFLPSYSCDWVGSKTAKLCKEEDFFVHGHLHENERREIEA